MPKRTVDFTGPISDTPLRDIDLVPAFEAILERYWPRRLAGIVGALLIEMGAIYDDDDDDWRYYYLQELIGALNEIAPPGHHFGPHPNDASNYGFWPIEDS